MNKIFIEENSRYQFDFSKATWASNSLHDIFHDNKQIWSDVDFIAEYTSSIENRNLKLLFVEYKNSNIEGAAKPNSFDPFQDKKINNIVRKFTDSIAYFLATNDIDSYKENYYVYIVETPTSDGVTRRLLRERIASRLPFEFQKEPQFKHKLISGFDVLSLEEWNKHNEYSMFPITKVSV